MTTATTCLILDLDGTLIDSRPGIISSFNHAAQTVFPGESFDFSSVRLGPPVRQMFQSFFPNASNEQLENLYKGFRAHYDCEGAFATELYDGASTILTECAKRGLALDIATNKPLHASTAILQHLRIGHFFRSVWAVDSTSPPFANKAEILRHILQENALQPSQTLYVGDSIEDANAAAACGIRFVWAAYGYGQLDDRSSIFRTINKLAELGDILLP